MGIAQEIRNLLRSAHYAIAIAITVRLTSSLIEWLKSFDKTLSDFIHIFQ